MKRTSMSLVRRAGLALAAAACLQASPALAEAPVAAGVKAEAAAVGLVQPGNNAEAYRDVRSGQHQSITFQAPEGKTLIQPEGQRWRELRNGPLTQLGGWLLVLVCASIAVFYKVRGQIRLEGKPTGRKMQRFSRFEVQLHWALAGTFMVLAVSGLLMLFGKHVLLPITGHTLFGWLAWLAKNLHNFVGPLFFVSTLLFVALFARDNLWANIDALWIRKAGGLLSGEHVPSWRFNFGEKTWFWIGVTILGLIVSITGLILDFPNFGQERQTMQNAHLIHAGGAVLFMALSIGHIYIGSIGMEGAIDSMKSGQVDETWAKEHHQLWHDQMKADGKLVGGPAASGAGASAHPAAPVKH